MRITLLPNCAWGVEVHDQQISEMTKYELIQVGQLLLQHQVVLLRGQKLTPEQEVNACYQIGDVEKVTAFHRCPQNARGDFIAEIQRVTGK